MTRRVVVRREAKFELGAAWDWYEARHPGLGDELIRTFESTIASITRNPFQFPAIYGAARRATVGKFPYSLIYTVSADANEIVVVSCFHGRRNPKRWQDRI
jgi:plasmid stabilization system protein ParE